MTIRRCKMPSLACIVVVGLAFGHPSASFGLETNDEYFIGTWAPKAPANCTLRNDPSNITFASDHRAHFLDVDYDWYLAEDLIVLKKHEEGKKIAAQQPAPAAAIVVSEPQSNVFNSMILLVGEGSGFVAKFYRCSKN
jgi:hypothetical protein